MAKARLLRVRSGSRSSLCKCLGVGRCSVHLRCRRFDPCILSVIVASHVIVRHGEPFPRWGEVLRAVLFYIRTRDRLSRRASSLCRNPALPCGHSQNRSRGVPLGARTEKHFHLPICVFRLLCKFPTIDGDVSKNTAPNRWQACCTCAYACRVRACARVRNCVCNL